MTTDQLVGYWDSVKQQFQGPGNTPSGSVELMQAQQVGNGATATVPLGVAPRAGILFDVRVAAITPLTGNDTYTVDIKKNGATVLTAPMALLAATGARASVVGSLVTANTPVAAGDFFEAAITYTHNTGTAPAGISAQCAFVFN